MGALRNAMFTFDEYCKEAKNLIFAYHNVEPTTLLDSYDEMLIKAEDAEKLTAKIFETMGISNEKIAEMETKINMTDNLSREKIYEGTAKFIAEYFGDSSLNKEGYCLKNKVVGRAVQMRGNENMLGFITETVEDSSRFVMVDFGDATGAVKIDVDELFFG